MTKSQELSSVDNKVRNKGPHGLGDPDDVTLRKVEIEVLIPKKMRERARNEKCVQEVAGFNKCCLDSGLSMVYKCRNENSLMKECLTKWYQNENFKNECRDEYLRERSNYRRTGISLKKSKEK